MVVVMVQTYFLLLLFLKTTYKLHKPKNIAYNLPIEKERNINKRVRKLLPKYDFEIYNIRTQLSH